MSSDIETSKVDEILKIGSPSYTDLSCPVGAKPRMLHLNVLLSQRLVLLGRPWSWPGNREFGGDPLRKIEPKKVGVGVVLNSN